jgi:hypothetical protein
MIQRAFVLILALAIPISGCTSDSETDAVPDAGVEEDTGVEEDVPKQITQGSFYSLTVVLPSGLQQKYERNIDEKPDAISYGSQHIGQAVSLAINDVLYTPFASIVFNFGFVVGSNDYPLTIDGTGRWDWGSGTTNSPPAFKIETKDSGIQRNYVSWLEGSEGHMDIESWGTVPGERIKGTIEGTLIAETGNPGEAPPSAYVVGEFQFFLPTKLR